MLSIFPQSFIKILSENPFGDLFAGIEDFFNILNEFFLVFFTYVKYIFAFILLIIGIMTLLRYRGAYRYERMRVQNKNLVEPDLKSKLKQSHVILGSIYLCMSVGIFFNYFTYFLIWILDPLPDRFLFQFINFSDNIDPTYLNRIADINASVYAYEKTIYYAFSFVSFIALVQIFVCIWTIVNKNNSLGNPMLVYSLLFSGIVEGMFFGFTTCLHFFI